MVHFETVLDSKLLARLGILKGSPFPVFLYFTATKEEGKRWCPDCRSAEPILEEAFGFLPVSATLLTVELSKASWKGSVPHPFRSSPFSLSGIPSLCVWDTTNQKVIRKFTEAECEQLEALQELMSSFQE